MAYVTSSLVVAALLAISAFFVAAQFALVRARSFRFEPVALQGSSAARLTLRIQADLENYLAVCQLAVSMALLGLGWVGGSVLAALLRPPFMHTGAAGAVLPPLALLLMVLVLSVLHAVIGERLPKALAIRRAEPVSLWVAWPVHLVRLVLGPLNWLIGRAVRSLLAWSGVTVAVAPAVAETRDGNEIARSAQDVPGTEAGGGSPFGQRCAFQVMTDRSLLKVLDLTESPASNLTHIRDSGHGCFPLIDAGNAGEILGIVRVQDLFSALLNGEREPWKDLGKYCRPALRVPVQYPLPQLLSDLRAAGAEVVCIVDDYGELAGMVTLADVIEELFGELDGGAATLTPELLRPAPGEPGWCTGGPQA